jgi:hypothetical protein
VTRCNELVCQHLENLAASLCVLENGDTVLQNTGKPAHHNSIIIQEYKEFVKAKFVNSDTARKKL